MPPDASWSLPPRSLLLLMALLLWPTPLLAQPQRIVSYNLCADQLLLLLVGRERIASVSAWSARPENSYMAALAQTLPLNRGRIEEIVPLQPDLILTGRYTDPVRLQMLRRLGYPVVTLDVPGSVDEAVSHILEFGELVEAQAAARAMADDMAAQLAQLQAQARELPPRLAVIYAANGVTAGAGTLLHELLRMAGWRNLAAELGVRGYGRLPLEQLLLHEPELLVIEGNVDSGSDSLAERALRHPVLVERFAGRHVLLPAALTACVGPMNLEAVALLLAAR